MDSQTISLFADAVAQRLGVPSPWIAVALTFLVSLIAATIAATIGAYGGAFLRIKGEHLATKSDFANFKAQLSENTEVVEAIKSAVSHADWLKRERNAEQRLQLQAIIKAVFICEHYIDRMENWAFDRKEIEERFKWPEDAALAASFFPSLRQDLHEVGSAAHQSILDARQVYLDRIGLADGDAKHAQILGDFSKRMLANQRVRFKANWALMDEAHKRMNALFPLE